MITPKTGVCPTPPPNKISRGVMMSLIAYFPSSDKKGVSQVADANPKPFLTSPLLIRGRAHLQYRSYHNAKCHHQQQCQIFSCDLI